MGCGEDTGAKERMSGMKVVKVTVGQEKDAESLLVILGLNGHKIWLERQFNPSNDKLMKIHVYFEVKDEEILSEEE